MIIECLELLVQTFDISCERTEILKRQLDRDKEFLQMRWINRLDPHQYFALNSRYNRMQLFARKFV